MNLHSRTPIESRERETWPSLSLQFASHRAVPLSPTFAYYLRLNRTGGATSIRPTESVLVPYPTKAGARPKTQ
jgi:hypothetical protein